MPTARTTVCLTADATVVLLGAATVDEVNRPVTIPLKDDNHSSPHYTLTD